MAHARWWDLVGPQLATVARPFALDRRGHGDSDWTEVERYGWERDLLDIESVMRALSDEPWLLAGHSQGGLLAVSLATRGNVPLRGLVLLDVPLEPASPRLARAGRAFRRMPQLEYPTLEDAIRRFQPYPSPHRVAAPVLRYLAPAQLQAARGRRLHLQVPLEVLPARPPARGQSAGGPRRALAPHRGAGAERARRRVEHPQRRRSARAGAPLAARARRRHRRRDAQPARRAARRRRRRDARLSRPGLTGRRARRVAPRRRSGRAATIALAHAAMLRA